MDLRVARHTDRLDDVVAFYRDAVGLAVIGEFRGHDGYDGVFLDVPGTGAHLELTSGGAHGAPAPHPESLLVLYVGDEAVVRRILARVATPPVAPANPYWASHGVTVEDPDGFRVVLVPERWTAATPTAAEIGVEEHTGPRDSVRPLFELAEDSAPALDAYIDAGRLLVARDGDRVVVGHLQLTDGMSAAEAEVKNMAVDPAHRRRGVGRALMDGAIAAARADGRSRLVVATAAADTDNLRFYQRLGFRLAAIERDAFTEAGGYEPGLEVDGIPLRDRVWLDRPIGPAP
jgi:ribosomal protein S18 acetylase RimI-like enzyme